MRLRLRMLIVCLAVIIQLSLGQVFTTFMTLPAVDPAVIMQQAWLYTDGSPHSAFDLVKGKRDDSWSWEPFDVVAVADGVAIQSFEETYGYIVIVLHDQLDSSGLHRLLSFYA